MDAQSHSHPLPAGFPVALATVIRCDFLILGLPSERSAWLAQLFTCGDVHCWHDLSGISHGSAEIQARIEATPARIVGLCESGLTCWPEQLRPARIAYMHQRREEADREMAQLAGIPEDPARHMVALLEGRLAAARNILPGPQFSWKRLNDRLVVVELWEHLVPDRPFPEQHYEALRGRPIVHDTSRLRAAVVKSDLLVLPDEPGPRHPVE